MVSGFARVIKVSGGNKNSYQGHSRDGSNYGVAHSPP